MTMKKQTGLTIIKLMVLLLVAGIVGSFAINALIKHRCLSDPAAHMCAEKSSMQEAATVYALIRPQPESPA
jgi:Tfp pilus assembly protein PilE